MDGVLPEYTSLGPNQYLQFLSSIHIFVWSHYLLLQTNDLQLQFYIFPDKQPIKKEGFFFLPIPMSN